MPWPSGYDDSAVASADFTVTTSSSGQQPYGGSPWPVPGTIEAEDYDIGGEAVAYHDRNAGNNGAVYRTDDVDIWRSDTEGYYTGANATGDWLEYTVDVATTGQYQLDLRVATPYSGRQLRVNLDGTDVTGLINLPNTGGWTAWQTVSTTATLSAGQHVLRVSVVVGGLNFNWMDFYETGGTPTVATPTVTPAGGTFSNSVTVSLQTTTPGATIYYTTDGSTPSTASAVYTSSFMLTADATVNAYAVASGYTDSPIASADFTVTAATPTVATPTISPAGGTFSDSVTVTLDTTTAGATIHYTTDGTTPSTASGVYTGSFTLTADATVSAFAVASGYDDSAMASADFTVTTSSSGQQPYGGSPWPVPGTIEAEDYDIGGEAVAYHDRNAGNNGAVYRTDDVDIWRSDTEGYYTGANATGDWLEYTVDVATTGQYQLDLRVATPYSGRQLRVNLDGTDVTGLINLPNTGGWTAWQTVSTTATLSAGQHVLRVSVVVGGLNFNWMDFYETGGTPTVATPTVTPAGGTFSNSVTVSLQTTTPGATIYYTTDGSTPNRFDRVYIIVHAHRRCDGQRICRGIWLH